MKVTLFGAALRCFLLTRSTYINMCNNLIGKAINTCQCFEVSFYTWWTLSCYTLKKLQMQQMVLFLKTVFHTHFVMNIKDFHFHWICRKLNCKEWSKKWSVKTTVMLFEETHESPSNFMWFNSNWFRSKTADWFRT